MEFPEIQHFLNKYKNRYENDIQNRLHNVACATYLTLVCKKLHEPLVEGAMLIRFVFRYVGKKEIPKWVSLKALSEDQF